MHKGLKWKSCNLKVFRNNALDKIGQNSRRSDKKRKYYKKFLIISYFRLIHSLFILMVAE